LNISKDDNQSNAPKVTVHNTSAIEHKQQNSSLYDATHLKYYAASILGLDVLYHSGPALNYMLKSVGAVGLSVYNIGEAVVSVGNTLYYSGMMVGHLGIGVFNTALDVAHLALYTVKATSNLGMYILQEPVSATLISAGIVGYGIYEFYGDDLKTYIHHMEHSIYEKIGMNSNTYEVAHPEYVTSEEVVDNNVIVVHQDL